MFWASSRRNIFYVNEFNKACQGTVFTVEAN